MLLTGPLSAPFHARQRSAAYAYGNHRRSRAGLAESNLIGRNGGAHQRSSVVSQRPNQTGFPGVAVGKECHRLQCNPLCLDPACWIPALRADALAGVLHHAQMFRGENSVVARHAAFSATRAKTRWSLPMTGVRSKTGMNTLRSFRSMATSVLMDANYTRRLRKRVELPLAPTQLSREMARRETSVEQDHGRDVGRPRLASCANKKRPASVFAEAGSFPLAKN